MSNIDTEKKYYSNVIVKAEQKWQQIMKPHTLSEKEITEFEAGRQKTVKDLARDFETGNINQWAQQS